jgi:hypothetical protein
MSRSSDTYLLRSPDIYFLRVSNHEAPHYAIFFRPPSPALFLTLRSTCESHSYFNVRRRQRFTASVCKYGALLQVWSCLASMELSCKYGVFLQVWSCLASIELSCKYGVVLQVWSSLASMELSCKYGAVLQVWSCLASMELSYKYGAVLQV